MHCFHYVLAGATCSNGMVRRCTVISGCIECLAIIGVYLSSYASDSCIVCVFIVAFLQDGDLTPMIVARYLHRYNDDTRPAMSMESFCYQCNSKFLPRSCYGF